MLQSTTNLHRRAQVEFAGLVNNFLTNCWASVSHRTLPYDFLLPYWKIIFLEKSDTVRPDGSW